ncbi:NAD(P)/FAD-dependent oxidoreductase [Candidatus Woesearchaeota archaeon]|jgi:digeranylgeranylglycerophospholipid reductase|nr:NAD(P)/FAD-dependent oxidoreductase [Candidatus Woesearchaeota archaeon]
MKIAIIGAGPVGCYTGYLLAKQGYSVKIYENHSSVGSPIQCTGLLTKDFDKLGLSKKDFLVNTFEKVTVYSPNGKVTIPQKEYLVCRTKFDKYFAKLALNNGVVIKVNHTFIGRSGKTLRIKNALQNKIIEVTPDIVIGADGPLSPVAKAFSFYHPKRKNYFGIQALVKGKFDPKFFSAYFSKDICSDLFAWIVPESISTARVGLAMYKDSKKYFDKFMAENGFKSKEIQGGTIPLYCPQQKLQKDNCYLVGDAATFVKATTLGGLIPGLWQARVLADCIKYGKDYQKSCRPLARRLHLHLWIKRIFDNFSDKDWNKLVKYVSQPRVQKSFKKYTRDNPLPLVISVLLREPRLLWFGRRLF